jgi:hypothetical protein
MQLRILSVVGEALNFGSRRMETIMRVAWLPVVLLLVLNMATVFALLSVALERPITFSDAATFTQAQNALGRLIAQAEANHPQTVLFISIASFALQAILVASYMAPLIRYAGLGERPGPGVVKVAFGPDQIRFVLAMLVSLLITEVIVLLPIQLTAVYLIKYIAAALSQTLASFPNPDSLHTIELVTMRETLVERGGLWVYELGLPLAAAAPFALLAWIVLIVHFNPKHSGVASSNLTARALGALAIGAVAVGAVWLGLSYIAKLEPATLLYELLAAASPAFTGAQQLAKAYSPVQNAIFALAILIIYYASMRLAPYPGIVVCRKSMAPAGMLKVSRGWNVFRLLTIVLVVGAFILIVQIVINRWLFPIVLTVVNYLYVATASATKLTNSGVEAEWARPLFAWIWNILKILVNIFLAFFSAGVVAGLLGRLYRESERKGDEPVSAPPWRRA